MIIINIESKLIQIWKLSGLILGFIPTIISPKCLYYTVDAVETFVEEHYNEVVYK